MELQVQDEFDLRLISCSCCCLPVFLMSRSCETRMWLPFDSALMRRPRRGQLHLYDNYEHNYRSLKGRALAEPPSAAMMLSICFLRNRPCSSRRCHSVSLCLMIMWVGVDGLLRARAGGCLVCCCLSVEGQRTTLNPFSASLQGALKDVVARQPPDTVLNEVIYSGLLGIKPSNCPSVSPAGGLDLFLPVYCAAFFSLS